MDIRNEIVRLRDYHLRMRGTVMVDGRIPKEQGAYGVWMSHDGAYCATRTLLANLDQAEQEHSEGNDREVNHIEIAGWMISVRALTRIQVYRMLYGIKRYYEEARTEVVRLTRLVAVANELEAFEAEHQILDNKSERAQEYLERLYNRLSELALEEDSRLMGAHDILERIAEATRAASK